MNKSKRSCVNYGIYTERSRYSGDVGHSSSQTSRSGRPKVFNRLPVLNGYDSDNCNWISLVP